MARTQPPRVAEELLAPFRVLAGGEDLATAGAALVEGACRALEAHGAKALPPVRKDVACTEVYGGAQTATITGTWQGQRVRSSFSRVNGCEIGRWDLLRGLLAPGGS